MEILLLARQAKGTEAPAALILAHSQDRGPMMGETGWEDQRLQPQRSTPILNQERHSEKNGPLCLPQALEHWLGDFAQGKKKAIKKKKMESCD